MPYDNNEITVVFVQGSQSFKRTLNCRYCYQLNPDDYICKKQSGCKVNIWS